MRRVERAIAALRAGEPILIYDKDGREEETDMVIAAAHITPKKIYRLRSEAGGLICVAIPHDVAARLGLPYMTDLLQAASAKFPSLASIISGAYAYGDRSTFSLTVNHRNTYTGVTDHDRALTIRQMALLVQKALNGDQTKAVREEFAQHFQSPGHVHLLIAHKELVRGRRGHTELSLALTHLAGLTPATVVCEMLNGETGRALSKQEAQILAESRNTPFVEGEEITAIYGLGRASQPW